MADLHSHICAPAVLGQGAHSWMHDNDCTFKDPKLCPMHMAEYEAEATKFQKVSLTFLEEWPHDLNRYPLMVRSGEREVNVVDQQGKVIAREQITWQHGYNRVAIFLIKLIELLNFGAERLYQPDKGPTDPTLNDDSRRL